MSNKLMTRYTGILHTHRACLNNEWHVDGEMHWCASHSHSMSKQGATCWWTDALVCLTLTQHVKTTSNMSMDRCTDVPQIHPHTTHLNNPDPHSMFNNKWHGDGMIQWCDWDCPPPSPKNNNIHTACCCCCCCCLCVCVGGGGGGGLT